MSKNKKVAKSAINKPDAKTVRSVEKTIDDKPVWRFSTTDKGGMFKWPKGQNEELTIISKLHDFDSMNWNEITGKQHHPLSDTGRLSKEAIDRLTELDLDDEAENLFSFHLGGKPRFIAIKHGNIAKLFWYDPEHRVSPSFKKHT